MTEKQIIQLQYPQNYSPYEDRVIGLKTGIVADNCFNLNKATKAPASLLESFA